MSQERRWPNLSFTVENKMGNLHKKGWSHFKLKACARYFLSNFYFSPNDSPSKTMKNVFYFI